MLYKPSSGKDDTFVRMKLQDEIAGLELELKQVAARLEIRGLEPDEIARLQEVYTDITIVLEALIKEWEEYKSE
jgi:hypothetical protein